MTTSEIATIASAVEEFRRAMLFRDRAALERLVADELTYGHGNGRSQSKAQFIESAGVTGGKSPFTDIVLSEQTITVVDNVAWVRHVFEGKKGTGSAPSDEDRKLAILLVWLRRDREWKLLARQAVDLKKQ